LESTDLRRVQGGGWNLIGRARNISEESLPDTGVLIQTLKIQSLAKATFPQYPMRIEEPITWVGRKEEEGG
jgi:hypothetical protein